MNPMKGFEGQQMCRHSLGQKAGIITWPAGSTLETVIAVICLSKGPFLGGYLSSWGLGRVADWLAAGKSTGVVQKRSDLST